MKQKIDLESFPRISFCHKPTPLEPMPRLTEHLGGAQLFVKRDDCTGLAIGGNKTRKLEFLMGEAVHEGATTVITVGGVQSNHARQTAAAAAKLGLSCELVLPRSVKWQSDDYEVSGNVLLDNLLGAKIHITDDLDQTRERVTEIMERVSSEGGSTYFIPAGGSTAVGSLGYVAAAMELLTQANETNTTIDHLVLASSTGGTQAGLVTGLAALESPIDVTGVAVYEDEAHTFAAVKAVAASTSKLLNIDEASVAERIRIDDAYLGPGYGMPTDEMVEAISLAAKLEGLLLDPVYTGKAMAGLIGMVRNGRFKKSDIVVFLHTGGTPALFPYREALIRASDTDSG